MQSSINIADFVPQLRKTLQTYQGALLFLRKYRLWEGFWQYSWVTRLLIIIALFIGIKFFGIFLEWFNVFRHSNTMQFGAVVSGMFTDLFKQGYGTLFSGGAKYVMLILLEVIIFHVSRRTLDVLRKDLEADLSFNNFVKAQTRMIQVVLFSWIIELVITILIGVALGLVGLKFMKPGLVVVVECFLIGFAVVDNYNEQFHLSIEESWRQTLRYAGVAMGIGVVLYILMLIPIIGPIIGPILAAVTATIIMHEISDIQTLPDKQIVEPVNDTV